jgi:hypothetical protein
LYTMRLPSAATEKKGKDKLGADFTNPFLP